MPEGVRLVIWDLDEVLGRGTLTEGGIQYDDNVHRAVIELTQRGIMNSICSNNDHAQVKALLVEKGLLHYFIVPSITWQPKGPRLQAIVEAVQLRSETILFIDDNPTNLAEAQHFVPGIQVCDETIVPDLVSSEAYKEIASVRHDVEYSVDHSLLLQFAARGAGAQAKAVFRSVGYQENVLTSRLFQPWHGRVLRLLSFFADTCIPIYRHRMSGVRVPLATQSALGNLLTLADATLSGHPAAAALASHRDSPTDFEYEGLSTEPDFKANVRAILAAILPGETYIIRPDYCLVRNGSIVERLPNIEAVTGWLKDVLADFADVQPLSLSAFVMASEEQHSANFFDRLVYYRAFLALRDGQAGMRHFAAHPALPIL